MSSYKSCQSLSEDDISLQRYPIQRLEPAINKFVKVINIDIERLQRHRNNIRKFTEAEDWIGLDKEQINATRTVQQIKANVREIENARNKTAEEDLHKFDAKVKDFKENAVRAVETFMCISEIETEEDQEDEHRKPCEDNSNADSESQTLYLHPEHHKHGDSQSNPDSVPPVITIQSQLHAAPDNVQAAASWENLQENLIELNTMIHDFATVVEEQGGTIDRIEDNIEKAHCSVQEGTKNLSKATKYKAAMLPAAGAMIGGILGGPIGLVAGLKIGSLVAVGGGVAGFFGGRLLKKRQEQVVNVEMSNLADKRSTSLPDLHSLSSSKS